MIQQSQVNKYANPLPQGVQSIKVENNQIHTNMTGNSLASSGGSGSNQNAIRNSNILHSGDINPYNTSLSVQASDSSIYNTHNKQTKNSIPKENGLIIKQEENKAISQGSQFLQPSILTKLNSSSYGLQAGNPYLANVYPGGGEEYVPLQQKEGLKNHQDIHNNSSQNINMNEDQEISNRSKVCSFSCLPKDDQQDRIIYIKGGIMIDKNIILNETSSDFLVHQNFSQYIECNLYKKFSITSNDSNQPTIVVIEIPIKKKESDEQFDDLIIKFRNGNKQSFEIATYLEQYQIFLRNKIEQEKYSNQIMKQEESYDNNSNKNSLHLSHSGHQSSIKQPKSLSNFQSQDQQQKQQQQILFKNQSNTNENQIDSMQNQGRNSENYNLSFSQNNGDTNSKLIIKKDQTIGNQSLIQKNNQQQQIQQSKQVEAGNNQNKNSQVGSKNKFNQQNQPQTQSQSSENIYKNKHDEESGNKNEKIYRQQINQILLKHQSEYFSYIVVIKNNQMVQHSSDLNSSFQNCSDEIDLQNNDEDMRIGHNTNFMTLLCQDEEQLPSKMMREKKLCIFITKLSREKYLDYIKQRILNEMNNNNNSLSFPKTCISALDSIFSPIISQQIQKNYESSANSKFFTKQSSLSNDEKILNPETHMNSSASSSSTIQDQNTQQLHQQSKNIQIAAQKNQYQGSIQQNTTINNISKCPFSLQNTNISNYNTTDREQNKILYKTYKQIDIITLDDLIFPVNVDVVEEETQYLKVIIFKFDISETHIKELEQNRLNNTGKQGFSMNTSGNGTPFQRKSNKKHSLKQNFTDSVKSRDKSVTISHPDEKIKSSSNFSTSQIPFISFNCQDTLNPKNMQYESKSEIFVQKFYSQNTQQLTKMVSDCGFSGSKQPGEGSASTKHSKRRFTVQESKKIQLPLQHKQDEKQDLMDEEYLEQQFKINNPTFEDNDNKELTDFQGTFQQYQQQEYLKNNQNTQSLAQYNSQQETINPKVGFQQQINSPQNIYNTVNHSVNQPIGNIQINPLQTNLTLKIDLPKQSDNQFSVQQSNLNSSQKQQNNIGPVFNPNQQDEQLDSLKEGQSEKGKKKTTQKNNKKKVENEEQEKKVSKTKRIKKDDSQESQNKAVNNEKTGVKKQKQGKQKEDQKLKDQEKQKEEEINQSKINTNVTTQSEIENEKISNDIVSLRSIPAKQYPDNSSLNKINQEVNDKQSLDQIHSQASQNQYPNNSQQLSQTNLGNPTYYDQSKTPEQQIFQQQQPSQHIYQYQASPYQNVNQPIQNPNQPQQHLNHQTGSYPQLYMQQNQIQQAYPNMHYQSHQGRYQNQSGQFVPVNGNQQYMQQYLNSNGQQAQNYGHIPPSPQISYSPYLQAQKPSSYSLSPNLTSQQASKSSPQFAPLDIDSQNSSLKQQGNQFNYQPQPQPQQIQNQNQFQAPQLKSQPNLIQIQQNQTQDSEKKQEVSKLQLSDAQSDLKDNDNKKKNKKKEPKLKKQNSTLPKNNEDEDDEEQENNKEKAPKKTKKIQKGKEEDPAQIKTSPNKIDPQQKESAKPKQKRQINTQKKNEKSQEEQKSLNTMNKEDNTLQQQNSAQQNLNQENQQQQNDIPQNRTQNPYNQLQQPQMQYQFQQHYPHNLQNQVQYDYEQYNMYYPQTQNQQMSQQYGQQFQQQYQHIQNINPQQVNHYNLNGQTYQYNQPQQFEHQQPIITQPNIPQVEQKEEPAANASNKSQKKGKESQPKSKASKANKATN